MTLIKDEIAFAIGEPHINKNVFYATDNNRNVNNFTSVLLYNKYIPAMRIH